MTQMIRVGDTVADFELIDQNGATVTLSEVVQNGEAALVFFPLAFSGICTGELCQVRDNIALFADAGIEVLAVSVDSKFALRAWAEREGFEFRLLSDFWPHGQVARQFGVFVEEMGVASRATFIISKDMTVRAAFFSEVGQARDFDQIKAAISS